jgi:hypothetical protein
MLIVCQKSDTVVRVIGIELFQSICWDSLLQSFLLLLQLLCCHTCPLPHHHYHTSPALLRVFMNSTTINFITEFIQTMLSKRQTKPPRRSTRLPSNCQTQAQGAQAAGQAAFQHASPAAFSVASPRTNAASILSMCLTRSSSKAVATMFPDAVATTLPNSADANCTIGG